MNPIEPFARHAALRPRAPAVWLPSSGATTFRDLAGLAGKAQRRLREAGVGAGDAVLVCAGLSPLLYATVIGVLGLGAAVILVEPWMPMTRIDRVIASVKPRAFFTTWLGALWGARVPAVRRIPRSLDVEAIPRAAAYPLVAADVSGTEPGIITFTSGTTGEPKGVVRLQSYLIEQHRVFTTALGLDHHTGPDLTIFANVVLANLTSGRASIVVPPAWTDRDLARIAALPADLQPETLTTGPAFLAKLLGAPQLTNLRSIHVGGALTDLALFEQGFARWPDAHWLHVYGSSEAEPVATCDAREAVALSRARGVVQALHVGRPVADIRAIAEPDQLWVTGPHVCPRYLGNDAENARTKRTDSAGRVWHNMGDRIALDETGWWYAGRSGQRDADFQLEQRIYAALGSTASFVHRDATERLHLIGKNLRDRESEIRRAFPDITTVVEATIVRDLRHRARLDRTTTIRRGARWLVG